MAKLDSKIDDKVSSLDTKLDVILKSLSEMKQPELSKAERKNQIDQLISLCFKHTL